MGNYFLFLSHSYKKKSDHTSELLSIITSPASSLSSSSGMIRDRWKRVAPAMSFFVKLKNILKAPVPDEFRKGALPPIVQVNVNPKDSWDIIGELGDGAFGKVEKAVSKSDKSKYAAAKAIEVQDGETIEDFLVEIEILTACKHINIVDLYAAYFHDNKLHMMLELCGGGAVDGIMIELEKPLTEPQIAYIAKYTNEALIFLHDRNVIHRDLKAGNILLTTDGVVKLADFGVSAKLKDRNERRDTFIGTPYWMAPEVMMCETFKDQPYTTVSDIWSFGITLIEMAQMEPPHSNVSPLRVLIKVQKSEPPTLDRPSAWSIYFNDFLTQCLVKDPAKRRSALELQSHPFIRENLEKKPVLTLMAEVNADIHEEVIVDDERSVDGSLPESEDPDDGSWALRSQKVLPAVPEVFRKPETPTTPVAHETLETPKKRAAPPPPEPKALEVSTIQIDPMDKTLTVSPVPKKREVPSPRKEALDVLDDLNGILDGEGKDDYFDDMPSSAKEPWMMAPASPSPTRASPVPPSNIKQVIQSAKASSSSPVPRRTPSPAVSEHLTASFHNHNNEVHIRIDDSVPQQSYAKTQLAVSPVKSSSKGSISTTSSQSRLSLHVEKESSATSEEEPEFRQSHANDVDIPEGHVKSKIKQVIEEQAIVNESFDAKKLAQERREADAVLFKTPAVAKIAASFQQPAPTKDQNYNNYVPQSPSTTKKAMLPPTTQQLRNNNEQPAEKPNYFAGPLAPKDKAPPPEPPVDYEKKLEYKENNPPVPVEEERVLIPAEEVADVPKATRPMKLPGEPRVGARKNPARQTITKKTRTYMIDGMQVTSTTMHVLGAKEDMQMRKQQLQDLRRLQREEARQKQELQAEGINLAEQQDRKFQQEKLNLLRQCEMDMEALERKQKREIEEAEKAQEEELRQAQKKIKLEQEKDLTGFKARKKQEMKIIMKEMELLPRSARKEAMKLKKDQLEHENHMQEADFLLQLQKNAEATLMRLAQKHKERIAQLERQFLMQKHILLRAKENNEWELEEKQMGEKYVLHRKLFKDEYFLLRTQMLARHQKEMAQAMKIHQDEEEELIRALAADRKKLPKVLRQEAKTRSAMFKESLRIGSQYTAMSGSEINEKVRRFEDQENARARHALEEHDQKSARKIALLKERHAQSMRELEEIQNEKKKQLLEKERVTMQEHEKKYYEMREQWQADLVPRKMMLESKFQEELESQERFYGVALHGPQLASTSVTPPRYN